METFLFVILALLVVIILLLVGVILFFLYRYISLKNPDILIPTTNTSTRTKIVSEAQAEIDRAKMAKVDPFTSFCIDHPELVGKGRCSISDDIYCELCITTEDEVRIARKYLHLFMDNEWESILMLNNQVVGADKLNELMRVKRDLWKTAKIPIIAQEEFKINIEDDKTEAYTRVMVRGKDEEIISHKLGFLI